jgi:hypothetical protein
LERHGVPTVVICSDEFGPLGRAEAQALGLPGLPLVPVPHPLAGNHADLVAAKARGVADEVLEALTADAAVLADVHRARFTRLTQRRLEHGAVCLDEVCAVDPALSRSPT